ncbi:hypothetical protein ACIRVK_18860 [Streptomyces sp. NPDC101152]|uniref:hypothetical protein n=1 Tax=Streptomyces sp. NPDC101152 TaxID=3366116 RepID=UPI0037F93FDE
MAVLLAASGCTTHQAAEGTDDSGAASPERSGSATMRGITLPSWNRTDYDSPAADRYLRGIRATGAR